MRRQLLVGQCATAALVVHCCCSVSTAFTITLTVARVRATTSSPQPHITSKRIETWPERSSQSRPSSVSPTLMTKLKTLTPTSASSAAGCRLLVLGVQGAGVHRSLPRIAHEGAARRAATDSRSETGDHSCRRHQQKANVSAPHLEMRRQSLAMHVKAR